MIQTKVSTKYQVVIPKKIRKEIGIKPGQKMDIKLEGKKIVLTVGNDFKNWKWPEDYYQSLKGIWKPGEAEKYLEEERNSWD